MTQAIKASKESFRFMLVTQMQIPSRPELAATPLVRANAAGELWCAAALHRPEVGQLPHEFLARVRSERVKIASMTQPRTKAFCLVFLVIVGVGACQKRKHPAALTPDAGRATVTSAVAPEVVQKAYWAKDPPAGFECEVSGAVRADQSLPIKKYVVFATPEACDVRTLDTVYLTALGHPDPAAPVHSFRIEPVVRNGEKLNVCGFGLDATFKNVIAFAAYPKNPLVFQKRPEQDELEIEDIDFELGPLPKAVELKSNRY